MTTVFKKTKYLTDVPFHYCPGCVHGIVHRLVAEVLEEIAPKKIIGVAPVGCAVYAYNYFNFDMQQAAHGRAPALASGIKRAVPDATVFTYQGDGDLASIGLAETVHAATRGENITVIFINNGIYGMTGGQLAPTTLAGQKTTTSKHGRDVSTSGNPIRMCELLATLDGPAFIARNACYDVASVRKTKNSIRTAFDMQQQGKGFSIVEILANCPTNFNMTPKQSLDFIRDTAMKHYPLGIFKEVK